MANAQLIVSQPGRRSRRIEVSAALVSIGRRPDNTLALEDDTNVSKYHAVIEQRGSTYWLTDLGSSNGTTVNGEPLRGERKLGDGDLINVGGTSTVEFRLAKGGDAAAGGAQGAGAAGMSLAQGAQSGAGAALSSVPSGLPSASSGLSSAASGLPPATPGLSAASSGLSSASSAASSLGSFSPAAVASSAASSAMAPANAAVSSATSAASGVTSAASAASSAAAAPAATVASALVPRLIVGGAVCVTLVGVAVAILFATGTIGGAKKPPGKDDPASIEELLATPTPAPAQAEAPGKNAAQDASAPAATNAAAPDAPGASAPPPPAPNAPATGDASQQEIKGYASELAAQLTQRSGSSYTFDPELLARISRHIEEYRAAAGYYGRARKYQTAVEREFSNNKGVAPLFAYLLAMSRTRFNDTGAGVWQLPMSVVKDYAPDLTAADMSDPDKSARAAAAYTRALINFQDGDNFMYVVACYGMPIGDAGGVFMKLQAKDPSGDQRWDFWKMKNAGVVSSDQAEAVARFFAAGIVCENPQRFGLRQDKPLSMLR